MTEAREVVDAVGRVVKVPRTPARIVSLCPSQTELLFALGAGAAVVGATQWCVHPAAGLVNVTRVGGTKKVNLKKVASLTPDLILCEKEENTREMVQALEQIAPVYVTNVESVQQALEMIETVGMLTGTQPVAEQLTQDISSGLASVKTLCPPLRTAYLIWKEPWMAAGHDTYISSLMEWVGLQNLMCSFPDRYPSFSLAQLQTLNPELLLLSSEPYAFTEAHAQEMKELFPDTRIQVVDGEMFSWYGSRMLLAAPYLRSFCQSLGQTL